MLMIPWEHREKPKGSHDVGSEDGKGTVAQGTLEEETVPPDMEVESLFTEAGLSDLHLEGLSGDLKL